MPRRVNISDTDYGRRIDEKLSDLNQLLKAYRSGEIIENAELSEAFSDTKVIHGKSY